MSSHTPMPVSQDNFALLRSRPWMAVAATSSLSLSEFELVIYRLLLFFCCTTPKPSLTNCLIKYHVIRLVRIKTLSFMLLLVHNQRWHSVTVTTVELIIFAKEYMQIILFLLYHSTFHLLQFLIYLRRACDTS